MADSLFSEFPASSGADWRAAAEKELKGKPFDETLRSSTPEGLTIEPIYDAAATEGLPHLGGLPGQAPFVRGAAAALDLERPWAVGESIPRGLPADAAAALARHVAGGGTAVRLVLDTRGRSGGDPDTEGDGAVGTDGISIGHAGDLDTILAGSKLATVDLDAGAAAAAGAALLAVAAQSRAPDAQLALGLDPIGAQLRGESLPCSLERALDDLSSWARWCAGQAADHVAVRVNGVAIRDAGGHAVQEIATSLATATEYLRAMIDRGIDADSAARQIEVELASGPRIFFEIAKIRAMRLLWSKVTEAFGVSEPARALRVNVRSTRHGRTQFDPWVNLIRGTLEGFVGAVAGAERIDITPFDAEIGPSARGFGERMARNTQHLLREEGHLGRVQDPAGGSHLVEALTDELARRAWSCFQNVEGRGGMAEAVAKGSPQAGIAEVAVAAAGELAKRATSRIGVTHFPNLLDERRPKIEEVDGAEIAKQRAKAIGNHRGQVDAGARDAALAALEAASPIESAERAIAAARAGATLGEIARARATEDRPPATAPLPSQPLTRDIEVLRVRAESQKERPRARVLSIGAERPGRRAGFMRDVLTAVGMQVELRAAADEATGNAALEGCPTLLALAPETDEAGAIASALVANARTAGATRIAAIGASVDGADVTLAASSDLFEHIEQLFDDLGIAS